MINERKSPRYPTPASRIKCELKLGSEVLPAVLLEESSGGFGVLVSALPGLSANKKVQLRIDRGWLDCRIIYARKVEPAKALHNLAGQKEKPDEPVGDDEAPKPITIADIKEFTASTQGPWLRLGIRRL